MSTTTPLRQDRTDLDERDEAILFDRVGKRAGFKGPRIGDFVVLKNGDVRRVTFDWDTHVQLTISDEPGSFYFAPNGVLDYSGGLAPAVLKSRFREVAGLREGACWFFHHNLARAHNGVAALIPCRVFEEVV